MQGILIVRASIGTGKSSSLHRANEPEQLMLVDLPHVHDALGEHDLEEVDPVLLPHGGSPVVVHGWLIGGCVGALPVVLAAIHSIFCT